MQVYIIGFVVGILLVSLISVAAKVTSQQKQIQEMEMIMDAIAEDVQEVRNITHGKPRITLPS